MIAMQMDTANVSISLSPDRLHTQASWTPMEVWMDVRTPPGTSNSWTLIRTSVRPP